MWLPEAAKELIEARDWYADIRPELGERFAQAVDIAVNTIAERPLQFQVVHQRRRRAGVRRFPYGIFFEVQEDQVVVIACFHSKRNAAWCKHGENATVKASLSTVRGACRAGHSRCAR
ncbi:MAG: type II toxin-antitoxin system RelE/ParE family toxin [Candidatus Acidiferrales bacterium]